ncbi:MAG: hypothetical protein MK085_00270 [Phycisphaerales bacterium]|nr:hypothetical protein [Phycisphaerales bacterium]
MHTPDSKDTDPYDLDPQQESETAGEGDESGHSAEVPAEENSEETCSNCGAPRAEDGDPVCPGCGYDHHRNTVVGTTEGIADAPSEAARPALITARSTRLWLVMAAIATLALVVAWLAGWSSLFPRSEGRFMDAAGDYTLDTPRFAERVLGLVRWLVAGSTLVGLGAGALRISAGMAERSVGPWSSALARICWIVTIAGLATLIPVDIWWLEWTAQLAVGCGLAAVGGLLVLGLRGVSLGIFMGAWAVLVVALVPMARLVTWSFNM